MNRFNQKIVIQLHRKAGVVMAMFLTFMVFALVGCEGKQEYIQKRARFVSLLNGVVRDAQTLPDGYLERNGCHHMRQALEGVFAYRKDINDMHSYFSDTICVSYDNNGVCQNWTTVDREPQYSHTTEMVNAIDVLKGHVDYLCALPHGEHSDLGQIVYAARRIGWFIGVETLPRFLRWDQMVSEVIHVLPYQLPSE